MVIETRVEGVTAGQSQGPLGGCLPGPLKGLKQGWVFILPVRPHWVLDLD